MCRSPARVEAHPSVLLHAAMAGFRQCQVANARGKKAVPPRVSQGPLSAQRVAGALSSKSRIRISPGPTLVVFPAANRYHPRGKRADLCGINRQYMLGIGRLML